MSDRKSLLQKEIQQKRPFRSRSEEAALGIMRTADVVRRHFGRAVEEQGITLPQYNVLRILRGAGESLPTLAIAERLVEQTPGITRMLDRLEAKEMIVRERSEEDRRQVRCQLSRKGQRVLRALDGPIDAADDACLAMLSRREQEVLIGLLDRIRAGHGS
jgi:DNA-binding MarR family transcriptional regulator